MHAGDTIVKKRNPNAVPRTVDEIQALADGRSPTDGMSPADGLFASETRSSRGKRQPNIVVWIMDDVGYGHLSPYGGLVEMPTMQMLTDRGMRFTNFHVTPLCAPTRAGLLTGRNHHTNHMGSLPRLVSEASTQDGKIPRENGFLSEILLEHGYATYCLGKWHLTTIDEVNVAASRRAWPLGRGFERFHGFIAGQSSQYNPHIVDDNSPVYPPPAESAGYHLSEDLATTGIRYVRELRSGSLTKPFFIYMAFAAGHAPHHVPKDWIERYRGKFDMGWDEYRRIVHARQKERGIFADDSPLSAPDPDVTPWSALTDDQRTVYARFMEAYAGMCSHMDAQFRRFVDELERLGELDDTIFIVLSDNGASSEGGADGAFNNLQFHGQLEQVSATLVNIDKIGSPESYNHYPWGWAWSGNVPFRRWKRETYRGGCAVPLIVSWKNGLPERYGNRFGYGHAIDVVPTLLELIGIDPPKSLAGIVQSPIEGTSFARHLLDPMQPSTHLVQYDEMMGHRAIYDEGWRAVCPWPAPSIKEAGPVALGQDHRFKEMRAEDLDRLEASGWELYRLTDDPAESRNLAKSEPQRLQRMIARWWYEAGRYGVLPMMGAPHGKRVAKPTLHVFFAGMAPVFIEAAPSVTNTDYAIEAHIEVGIGPDTVDGMILAHGGRFGGYGLLIRDARPVFVYNYFGLSETTVSPSESLGSGRHVVRVEFKRSGPPAPERGRGAPGVLSMFVDGTKVASASLVDTAAGMLSFTGMLSCGYHPGEPFRQGYAAPYRFNGTIHRVIVATSGASSDLSTDLDEYFRRQ